jgi:ubiquinone/menaquinone biosynthesis C-methylase UbiE
MEKKVSYLKSAMPAGKSKKPFYRFFTDGIMTHLMRRLLNRNRSLVNHFGVFIQFILDEHPKMGDLTILDVGSGDGRDLLSYRDERIKKIALDFDDEYKNVFEGEGVVFKRFDLNSGGPLPLEDDSCDIVLLSHVIEHVSDYTHLLSELYRVCRRGSLVAVRTPDVEVVKLNFFTDFTHVKPYTLRSLKAVMETHGFETILCTRFNYGLFLLSFVMPVIGSTLRKLSFNCGKEVFGVFRRP